MTVAVPLHLSVKIPYLYHIVQCWCACVVYEEKRALLVVTYCLHMVQNISNNQKSDQGW